MFLFLHDINPCEIVQRNPEKSIEFPSFPKNNSREILGKYLAFFCVNLEKIPEKSREFPGNKKVKMRSGKIPRNPGDSRAQEPMK